MADVVARSSRSVRTTAHPGLRRRSPRVGLLLVAAVVLTGVACASDDATPPPPPPPPAPTVEAAEGTSVVVPQPSGGTMRIAVTTIDSFDPADVVPTNQAAMIGADLLFESLTTIDPGTNQAVLALASDVRSEQLNTVWTFTLRPGATFSDGSPVTADDVKFSLERVALKGSSLSGSSLEVIAGYGELVDGRATELSGVAVVDEHTVRITTSVPYASLPELLASPVYGIVSKAGVAALKSEYGLKPIGSGPLTFVSQDDTTVTLRRSTGSDGRLDGVTLVKFATKDAALQALKDGQADWAAVPSGASVDGAEAFGVVQPGYQSSERFFAFKLGNPLYGGNIAFRQAIVKGIDRQKIATDIFHGAAPLNAVVPPSLPGGSPDACGEPCAYDPDAARALLASAFPSGVVPPIVLDYYSGNTPDDQAQQSAAEAIQRDLAAIGVTAQLNPKPFDEYYTVPRSEAAQVFSYGWVGLAPDPDAYLAPLFLSDSQHNVTGLRDPAVDAAIKVARVTASRSERMAQYQAIERQIMASVPIIPLAGLQSTVIIAKSVQGYQPRFDGTFVVTSLSMAP